MGLESWPTFSLLCFHLEGMGLGLLREFVTSRPLEWCSDAISAVRLHGFRFQKTSQLEGDAVYWFSILACISTEHQNVKRSGEGRPVSHEPKLIS